MTFGDIDPERYLAIEGVHAVKKHKNRKYGEHFLVVRMEGTGGGYTDGCDLNLVASPTLERATASLYKVAGLHAQLHPV